MEGLRWDCGGSGGGGGGGGVKPLQNNVESERF